MTPFYALLLAVAGCHALAGTIAAVLCSRGHLIVQLRRKPEPRPAVRARRTSGSPS